MRVLHVIQRVSRTATLAWLPVSEDSTLVIISKYDRRHRVSTLPSHRELKSVWVFTCRKRFCVYGVDWMFVVLYSMEMIHEMNWFLDDISAVYHGDNFCMVIVIVWSTFRLISFILSPSYFFLFDFHTNEFYTSIWFWFIFPLFLYTLRLLILCFIMLYLKWYNWHWNNLSQTKQSKQETKQTNL